MWNNATFHIDETEIGRVLEAINSLARSTGTDLWKENVECAGIASKSIL